MEKNRGFLLIVVYFLAAVYLLPTSFAHLASKVFVSADELNYWTVSASLIEKRSFDLSWTQTRLGEIPETTKIDDKVYSTKAPVVSILAAPVYAATRLFVGEIDLSESNLRASLFFMRFFLSTLPLLLLVLWLYRHEADEFSLGALLFTNPLFIYSLLFFSHALAAVFVYLVFRILYDEKNVYPTKCFWAGLLAGLCVLTEYATVVPVLIFGFGLFFTEKRFLYKRLFWFVAGLMPFLALLLFYNYLLFGSPFPFLYSINFGFPPSPQDIFLLLFSPARGLFFFSPILFFSVIAFFTSRERGTLRHTVKILAVLISILILCGHNGLENDWSAGARILIFIVPLLLDSFFDGETDEFSNVWQGIFFTVSFLFCTIPALTFPFAPPEFGFPHNNFWQPLLIRENLFAPNLSAILFNLPAANLWTILPAVLLFLLAFYTVWQSARRPKRFFVGMVIGLILAGAYIFSPITKGNENKRIRRAEIVSEAHA